MRILVTSDSHGDYRRLNKAVKNAAPFDVFIFLGDGEKDFDIATRNMAGITTYRVRGNNDYDTSVPMVITAEIDSHKLLICHGSNLNLWRSYDRLISMANENGCSAALFGHTHSRHYSFENGIHLFNPGSVSMPRDGKPAGYGVITAENGKLDFYHYDL